jgi:hypothetical protein
MAEYGDGYLPPQRDALVRQHYERRIYLPEGWGSDGLSFVRLLSLLRTRRLSLVCESSGRQQRRIVDYKLIDFSISQVPPDEVHLWVFSSATFERQKLLTKVDAVLPCDVGYFNVVPNTVQAVAWSAHGSNGWRRFGFCFDADWTQHRGNTEGPTQENIFAD